jgi:hypothetical protein
MTTQKVSELREKFRDRNELTSTRQRLQEVKMAESVQTIVPREGKRNVQIAKAPEANTSGGSVYEKHLARARTASEMSYRRQREGRRSA